MTTSFSSLPIIDLKVLSSPSPSPSDLLALSKDLHDAFATTGFAYLANAPLSFNHEDVFKLASDFFSIPLDEKMRVLLHDHAVFERTGLGLVCVAEQISRLRRVLRNERPLHAGGESSAAAAT